MILEGFYQPALKGGAAVVQGPWLPGHEPLEGAGEGAGAGPLAWQQCSVWVAVAPLAAGAGQKGEGWVLHA